jgi:outer membrane protein TolC
MMPMSKAFSGFLALLLAAVVPATAQSGGGANTVNVFSRLPVFALPSQAPPDPQSAPVTITLQDALARARFNVPEYRAAVTQAALAREDQVQARAALLPTISSTNQFLYTEGNGTPSGVFIANNGVHEYISQGNAHQVVNLSGGQIAEYRHAQAAEAVARAKQEVAERGLVVTVVQKYYALVVGQRKYANTQEAAAEAERFLTLSRQLEHGGEVAHSEVIKAQLQFNDRQRELRESALAMEKARLALAVLVFPNFNQDFAVVDDLRLAPPLPTLAEAQQMAATRNPELRTALAEAQAASQEVRVAWAGHFPTLTLDAWYGIDATHFATFTHGVRNLGYAAAATLSIPVWNWGATQSKVRQAQLRRQQAQLELTFAQRQLLSNLRSSYAEANAAHAELEILRASAELAAESLRLTNLRYRGGEATALEVVDAQNTLVLARNAYDDGEARYREALANLQTLTGSF